MGIARGTARSNTCPRAKIGPAVQASCPARVPFTRYVRLYIRVPDASSSLHVTVGAAWSKPSTPAWGRTLHYEHCLWGCLPPCLQPRTMLELEILFHDRTDALLHSLRNFS